MGNPIFGRSGYFGGQQPAPVRVESGQQYPGQRGGSQGWAPQGNQPYDQHQYQPGQYNTGQYNTGSYNTGQYSSGAVMTMDDVITKTSISLLIVAAVGVVAFMFLPPMLMLPALLGSAAIGFITVMIVSMRSQVSVAAVLAYALIEGVFVGAFAKMFELRYPGIALQAILATFAVAGCTLAAYKFFNIKVTPKFRKMVFIATAGFAVLMLGNFVFSLFTGGAGLRGGALGIVAALIGCALAVFNLVTDFDTVERGVEMGAPAKESWRAAFGITVTMVWLYTEVLRILSYLRR